MKKTRKQIHNYSKIMYLLNKNIKRLENSIEACKKWDNFSNGLQFSAQRDILLQLKTTIGLMQWEK